MTINRNIPDLTKYLSNDLVNFAFPEENASELKVIGIGGGGSNAVNHMFTMGIDDVELIICNTDSQALANSPVATKIQLGKTLTRGRGAGSKPEIGRNAAIESLDEIINKIRDNTDMVFLTAGMGGGTGTGAVPVIAGKIKELGVLTVAIVTLPFKTEIGNRIEHARKGVRELEDVVDALIIIENEKLHENYADLPLSEAFRKADEVLSIAAKSIIEIIKVHGVWNVDFNDIKTVMSNSKVALMGSGTANGENRAIEAVTRAMNSPLISNNNIANATNILINIISGEEEILMSEHQLICNQIQQISGHMADHFIIGSARDNTLGNSIKVTLIATGFSTQSIPTFQETSKVVPPKPDQDNSNNNLVNKRTKTGKTGKSSDKTKKPDKQDKKPDNGRGFGFQRLINFFDDDVE